MKIAYVTLHWPRTRSSGIGKKMLRQMDAWEQAGHSVTCYMHLHETQNSHELLPAKYFIYQPVKGKFSLLRRETSRIHALKALIQTVILDKPDLIYLRWGMYAIPLKKMFQAVPVVVEINTNDVLEHRLLGPFLNLYNRLTRNILLSRADGLVFTTRELSLDPVFAKYSKQRIVVSNGIDLDTHEKIPVPNTAIPHLVFIGTPDLAWQGIEKLVQLAEKLRDIHIDIIGCDGIPGFKHIPKNMTFHGYLERTEYQQILAQATAAIGTLSLYKKGMGEAAPLKIRECAAFGIPLILPYKDTDLHNLPCDSILEIPNTENNIHENTGRIHDFLYHMQGKRLDVEKIQKLIDIRVKEKERLGFFESMLQ